MSHYYKFYLSDYIKSKTKKFAFKSGTKPKVGIFQEAADMGIEIPDEMFDFIKVMIHGATKYEPNNWLKSDGVNSDHRSMHASMFRHLAESQVNVSKDHETGLDPLLHLATRALMLYTRRIRNLV